ncbi:MULTISPECIES: hypothetical protein [Cysteiniphilum]|uniref:Uncharacterized protein n=1 Tax=Cysteiniphilum litorale TaxID=2056700 RepID=A0A8J3EAG2_9GAMM|nr:MULTISPECIES: hypothetical protein [Cysteiniphilum]GGG08906.1 hypothetical protein GCM10010995_28110 [Cysteiniphilum litorale]
MNGILKRDKKQYKSDSKDFTKNSSEYIKIFEKAREDKKGVSKK